MERRREGRTRRRKKNKGKGKKLLNIIMYII